jgi:hypothetical protein
MMRLGIYANYDRGDVTAAAIRLSDTGRMLGFDVDYISPTTPHKGIHPFWDDKIRKAAKTKTIPRWLHGNQANVWFVPHAYKHMRAFVCNDDRIQIAVPDWHTITQREANCLSMYDEVICSCESMEVALERRVATEVTHCVWTSGVGMLTDPWHNSNICKILVHVDGYTLRRHAGELLATIDAVLSQEKRAWFTLPLNRRGSDTFRQHVFFMERKYGKRFKVIYKPNAQERLGQIVKQHWLWVASVRGMSALPVQEAVSCHIPTIAWNLEPFKSVVHDKWTGITVPCPVGESWLGAPTATWSTPDVLRVLSDVTKSDDLRISLQKRDWPTGSDETQFTAFWRRALKV